MSFALPSDIQLIIFEYARSPLKTSQVCKSWKQKSLSEALLNKIIDNFRKSMTQEIFDSLKNNIPEFEKLTAYQKLKSIFSRQWTKIAVRYNLNEAEARKFPELKSNDIFDPSKVAAAEKDLMDKHELDLFMLIRNLYGYENRGNDPGNLYNDYLYNLVKDKLSLSAFESLWSEEKKDFEKYKEIIINNRLSSLSWKLAIAYPENAKKLVLNLHPFENIPPEIAQFCRLNELVIDSGQLEYLPKEMLKMTTLKTFKIAGSNKLLRLSPAFDTTTNYAIKKGLDRTTFRDRVKKYVGIAE